MKKRNSVRVRAAERTIVVNSKLIAGARAHDNYTVTQMQKVDKLNLELVRTDRGGSKIKILSSNVKFPNLSNSADDFTTRLRINAINRSGDFT